MSAVAATWYRLAASIPSKAPPPPSPLVEEDEDEDDDDDDDDDGFAEVIADAVRRGECPAGWPKFAPSKYDRQLRTKADMCRCIFPELAGGEQAASSPAAASLAAAAAVAVAAGQELVPLEVLASPKAHHRMRARLGVEGTESADTVCYASAEGGRLESLPIACEGIGAAMPLVLAAVKRHAVLREHLACLNFLGVRDGVERGTGRPVSVVACLIYARCVADEEAWLAAAREEARRINSGGDGGEAVANSDDADAATEQPGLSFICQARGQRLVVGRESVVETYRLRDGRRLSYRHVFGHFSNPNAFACEHTLDFLSSAAREGIPAAERAEIDLLELYCGNGNHTVALAPLFRRALAVEINPSLVDAAGENLRRNGVRNATLLKSPSASFCGGILRRRTWTDRQQDGGSGHVFNFGCVLVDPPRAGLDAETRRLVGRYRHVLYVSCNPFVSLRRDLSVLQAECGFVLRRFALIDHFPYTPHAECAVYLVRGEGEGGGTGS